MEHLSEVSIAQYDDPSDYKSLREQKLLGMFLTVLVHGQDLNAEVKDVLEVRHDDLLLMINVGSMNGEFTFGDLIGGARESFRLVAKYIQHNNIDPRFVYGVAHESMAKAANLFGFETRELVSRDIVDDGVMVQYFRESPKAKKGKQMGKIMLVHMDKDQFMAKFAQ